MTAPGRGQRAASNASLRLIGGQWRGRRLPIADSPGLRPTPDRVRETLFNWLAPTISGARCIDLFAGTGALGLEALSRGAADVRFFESKHAVANAVRRALETLGAGDRAWVRATDALAVDWRREALADLAFIDPPFEAKCHGAALAAVAPAIAAGGRVYIEYAAATAGTIATELEPAFEILRTSRAGRVGFCLARRPDAPLHPDAARPDRVYDAG